MLGLKKSVSKTIHPRDQMSTANFERYFFVGAVALSRIRSILSMYDTRPKCILDLGCGCGRAARPCARPFPAPI